MSHVFDEVDVIVPALQSRCVKNLTEADAELCSGCLQGSAYIKQLFFFLNVYPHAQFKNTYPAGMNGAAVCVAQNE